jgi:hypothetical protein
VSLQATTSQTVGPFFKIGFQWLYRDNLAGEGVSGERVTIQGRVFDGDGVPVPDAILEIWQANAHGKYAHPEDTQDKPLEPGFKGYGRVPVSRRWAVSLGHDQAGAGAWPRREASRRRIFSSRCSCAECCGDWSRESIFPMNRAMPRTLFSIWWNRRGVRL